MGMWQLIRWPGATSSSGGSVDSQTPSGSRRGQRVWKTQPGGGSAADGISPDSRIRSVCSPSRLGTAYSSASVYG